MKCNSCGAPVENGKCTYCGQEYEVVKEQVVNNSTEEIKSSKKKKGKMQFCKACGKEISVKAKICPHCGIKIKKPIYKRVWFWILVLVIIGAIGSGGSDTNSVHPQNGGDNAVIEQQSEGNNNIPKESNEAQTNNENDTSVPREYKSALNKAETYSKMMNMSKKGIYDQLVSPYGENFPEEAAQYAVDNLNADYNENALKKAKTYSDTMYMSKDAIYDQLTSSYGEQFTESEAQYAVDNLEADYNYNALQKAKTYQDTMDMSKAAIYDQLVSSYGEKFTAEQAQYAIDNL